MKIIKNSMSAPAAGSCCHIHDVAHDHGSDDQALSRNIFSLELKFIVCLLFTLPLLLHMVLPWHALHNQYVQLALTTPVFIIGLLHFGRSALRSTVARKPNMDVLIVLGSSAAFIYSLCGTVFGLGENYLFYESAASIFTIVLFGNLLEKVSVKKTSSAIMELSKLQKVSATRVVLSGAQESTESIDSTQITVGDILIVNSGDKVPADSVIISGSALIDQSMITGESMPVKLEDGAKVIAGTIVTDGNIRIKAQAIGSDTVLSQIINLVKDAQSKKPDIERLADRISLVFVPLVLLISLLTFLTASLLFSYSAAAALLQAIAVLVIACPCALGLATPAAVMVGVGRAVKKGLLIKEGKTLEKLAQVKTVIFDKTGTLTNGVFKIASMQNFGVDRSYLESVTSSLEQHSSHPLAKSIVSELSQSAIMELTNVKEERGVGVHAQDSQGNSYSIGSYRIAEKLTGDHSRSMYVLKNGELIGTIDLEDQVKPESSDLVRNLSELGIQSVILSGDSAAKCKLIADKIGITKVYAEKSPQEKLQIVDEIQKDGLAAFVGDGINDAPALSKAAVGISLSSASQVAIQSAQVLLVGGKIEQLADAIIIGRKTLKIIKQNLFWAFIYNVVAIPIAALGFLTPTIAAFAMSFSDVIIILNSLRLKTFRMSK